MDCQGRETGRRGTGLRITNCGLRPPALRFGGQEFRIEDRETRGRMTGDRMAGDRKRMGGIGMMDFELRKWNCELWNDRFLLHSLANTESSSGFRSETARKFIPFRLHAS